MIAQHTPAAHRATPEPVRLMVEGSLRRLPGVNRFGADGLPASDRVVGRCGSFPFCTPACSRATRAGELRSSYVVRRLADSRGDPGPLGRASSGVPPRSRPPAIESNGDGRRSLRDGAALGGGRIGGAKSFPKPRATAVRLVVVEHRACDPPSSQQARLSESCSRHRLRPKRNPHPLKPGSMRNVFSGISAGP